MVQRILVLLLIGASVLALTGCPEQPPPTTQYTLTVTNGGGGTVTSGPGGIGCGSDCSQTYDSGTQVSLTASPDTGYSFEGWSGACAGTGSCQVTMTGSRAVTASFSQVPPTQYTLTVTNGGGGTVTSSPGGIGCGSDCSQTYDSGTQVSLTASPDTGYSFEGWSGACAGTGSCQVTMTGSRAVTASFSQVPPTQYTLTVTNGGGGTVISSPGGIDCGSDCSQAYDSGTTIVLTAAPDSGYAFAGWNGDCSGAGSCQLTLDEAKAVVATFTTTEYPLTVSYVGEGGIVSSPVGIACYPAAGMDCSQNYPAGAQVSLAATASSGYILASWGGACSGTGICVVTMDGPKTATASFIEGQSSLSVTNSGGGTVTSDPAGIDCGSDCSQAYDSGTQVSLTASQDTGYSFEGWSGDCTGTGSCQVTLDAAKAVSATFSASQPDGHAALGPLSGATIRAYRLSDLASPIEGPVTANQSLNDLSVAGEFDLTLNGVGDTEWILVTATGGTDIDADDDGVIDSSPTPNTGVLHGLARGQDWRGTDPMRVTPLSDLVWRYARNLVGKVAADELDIRLNDLAEDLLQTDLNEDGQINWLDVMAFVPGNPEYRAALSFDYQLLFIPDGSGDTLMQALLAGDEALLEGLLQAHFGHSLTLNPIPDSRYQKIKLSLSLFGRGRVESDQGGLQVDSEAAGSDQPTGFVVQDPAKTVTFTATPTADTELLSWSGCPNVSQDQTRCMVALDRSRHVVANFGFRAAQLRADFVDLSSGDVTISPSGLEVSIWEGDTTLETAMAGLTAGDFVLGQQEGGFLRKVTAVALVDTGQYRVSTEGATLEELVGQGTGQLRKQLTNADLLGYEQATLSSGATVSTQAFEGLPGVQLVPSDDPQDPVFRLQFGEPATAGTLQPLVGLTQEVVLYDDGQGGKVTAIGAMDFAVDVDFGASLGWLELESLKFITKVVGTESLVLTVSDSLQFVDIEQDIGTLKFARLKFLVGPVPVWITPEVRLFLGAAGNVRATLSAGIELRQEIQAGFIYNSEADSPLGLVGAFDPSWEPRFPALDVQATLAGYFRAVPGLMIYDVTGPSVPMKGSLGLYSAFQETWLVDGCNDGIEMGFTAGVECTFKWDFSGDTKFGKLVRLDELEDLTTFEIFQDEWMLKNWYLGGDCKALPPFLRVVGHGVNEVVGETSTQSIQRSFTVRNEGGASLPWSVDFTADSPIAVSPTSGNLVAGAEATVDVTVDTSQLQVGTYINLLTFNNNHDASTTDVDDGTTQKSVKVTVVPETSTAPLITFVESSLPEQVYMEWYFDPGQLEGSFDGYQIYATQDPGDSSSWQSVAALADDTADATTINGLPSGSTSLRMDAYGLDVRTPSSSIVEVNVLQRDDSSGSSDLVLNDTGITFCGSPSGDNHSPCFGSDPAGQDRYYGRDAAALAGTLTKVGGGSAGFDFTKIANDGSELPGSASLGSGPSDWACTRDNVTGLIWEVKTDDGGLRDKDWTYTWYDPVSPDGNPGTQNGGSCVGSSCDTSGFVAAVNGQGLCGASGWRMPTVKELHGIVNYGRYSPAIDTGYFQNTRSSHFWAGSPHADDSSLAWDVHFVDGDAVNNSRSNGYHVRLVRSGE